MPRELALMARRAVMLIALLAAAACADTVAPQYCYARECPAPRIDGTLAADEWTAARTIGRFSLAGSLAPEPEDASTDVRVAQDTKALYVAFTCVGTNVSGGFAGQRIVVVLDPPNEHRGGVAVNVPADGTASAAPVGIGAPDGFDATRVTAASSVADDTWTGEIAVPWEVLGMDLSWRRAMGLDVVRVRPDQGKTSRWSRASSSADVDPRGTGVLAFADNPLRVESLAWGPLHLGTGSLRLLLTNSSDEQLDVALTSDTDTAFADPPAYVTSVKLAARERREASVPFATTVPGRGVLRIQGDAAGRCLYASSHEYTSDSRFFVRGIGWMELALGHRLAGVTPIGASLRAVDCRPDPECQPPVDVSLTLTGPVGAGSGERARQSVRMEAIHAAVMRRSYSWPAKDLLAGDYAVTARISRGSVALGEGTTLVRVSRLTEADLGLAAPQRALTDILASMSPSAPVYRGAAALALRLQRAWAAYDKADVAREEELAGPLGAVRGEAAEAKRIADDLAQGKRPYQGANGTFLLAHWSRVDDTAQPYALFVPDTYADTRAAGLVLMLHGYDGGNGGFGFPGDPNDIYKIEAQKRGWLVLWPWGRGNQDWRDSGERDMYDLVDELRRTYSIDPDRIYLAGVSAGGRGVWHHAARRPDVWAGAIPIAGASSGQVWSIWQEERLAPNLLNVPAYIVHGAADSIVPVEDARTMYRWMVELGYDVQYAEFPTRGHEGFGDFAPALYQWMDAHPRVRWPAEVRYDTDWLRWSSAYWVTIEGIEQEGGLASIDARVTGSSVVEVTTRGVTAFSLALDGHPMVDSSRPVEFTVDGRSVAKVFLPSGGRLLFRAGSDGWAVSSPEVVADGARRPDKSPLACGPMRRVFADSFRMAYGTQGWDDERILGAYDLAHRAAERFDWWVWGNTKVGADSDVTDDILPDGGMILYGGPDTNSVARALFAGDLPEYDPAQASKLSVPNPRNPRFMAAVFSGPTARSLRSVSEKGEAWPLPPVALAAQDAEFQVADVDDEGRLIPRVEGCFDSSWRLPSLGPGLHIASDDTWRATHQARAGWTEADYDDSDWQAPSLRFRKEFDDQCWHYAALHKFGRLSETFAFPAMAMTARTDPERDRGPQYVSYFRRAFDLESAPQSAPLRVYLDDEGEVYVNGTLAAGLGIDDLATDLDIAPLLRPGRNVLAIRLVNSQYDECVALHLAVR